MVWVCVDAMTGKDATVKPPSAEQRGKATFLCVSGVFENWKIVIWSWKMSEARLACHVVVLSSSAGERLLEQKDGISQTLQLLS